MKKLIAAALLAFAIPAFAAADDEAKPADKSAKKSKKADKKADPNAAAAQPTDKK